MWERFELFWTAFEKFALFFAFIGTLAALVGVVLVYNSLSAIELSPPPTPIPPTATPVPPTPTPVPTVPVQPMLGAMRNALTKIQGAVSPVIVPISHTVPITLNIRINPSETDIKMVDKGQLKAGRLVINLDDAGQLIGKDAVIELPEGNTITVKLDVTQEVVFQVPIEVDIPIVVPMNVDLSKEIHAFDILSKMVSGEVTVTPQPASAP